MYCAHGQMIGRSLPTTLLWSQKHLVFNQKKTLTK